MKPTSGPRKDWAIEHLKDGKVINTTRKLTEKQARDLAFRLNSSGHGVRIKKPIYLLFKNKKNKK